MQSIPDISQFKNKRILIVGDIMLDEFVYTTSNRNSPEYKNVPVLKISDKKQYLGGAANVALNIKKLHAIPYLVGTIGNDENGKTIEKLLHKENITNEYLHINSRQKTTVKTRIFKNDIPIGRIDEEENKPYDELVNQFILKQILDAITHHQPHVIILQDYNKGILNAATTPAIIALAKQHHLKICVDPKFENWDLYKEVDLFKPNLHEFMVMSESESENENESEIESENKLLNNAVKLKEKINFKNLLVTLGADGNFIFDGEKHLFSKLKSRISIPDVCGAGDTVIAVAALGIACNFSLEQIAELSNNAGFIVCQKENVQPVFWEELVIGY